MSARQDVPPPTLIIGDRLNTANRQVRAALSRGDGGALADLAARQIACGADAIDVCACSSGAQEQSIFGAIVSAISGRQNACLISIDTQDPDIIAGARGLLELPPILNCYSGLLEPTEPMLDRILAARPVHAVVALCLNFAGPDAAPALRLRCADRLQAELCSAGVEPSRIVFDPITLPSSAGPNAERATLQTVEMLRRAFPASGVLCAVSNYSFGMTTRQHAERAFAARARDAGATCFLLDARDPDLCSIARGQK